MTDTNAEAVRFNSYTAADAVTRVVVTSVSSRAFAQSVAAFQGERASIASCVRHFFLSVLANKSESINRNAYANIDVALAVRASL